MPGFPLGSIRLEVQDARPLDRVCLYPLGGCACWRRTLLASGTVIFGFLEPGEYGLTLARGTQSLSLRVILPPGGNVVIRCALGRQEWCWRQDWFHCFYNAR